MICRGLYPCSVTELLRHPSFDSLNMRNMDDYDIPFLRENSALTPCGKLALLCSCFPGGLRLDDACRILHIEKESLADLPGKYFVRTTDGDAVLYRKDTLGPLLGSLAASADSNHDALALALSAAFHRDNAENLHNACQAAALAFSSSLSLTDKKVLASILIFVLTKRRFILKEIVGCVRFVSFVNGISPQLLFYGEMRALQVLLYKAKGMAFAIGNDKAYSFLHFAIQCIKISLEYAKGKTFDLHVCEESYWQLRNFHDPSIHFLSASFLSVFYIFTGKYFNAINIWRLGTLADSQKMPGDCVILENAFIGAMMTCQYSLARDIASSVSVPSNFPLEEIASLYCDGWKRSLPVESLKAYPPSPLLALACFLSKEAALAARTLAALSITPGDFLRYPFLPELLFRLEEQGFPLFSEQEWADEFRRARSAPNTVVRGIFLRISANRMSVSSESDNAGIISCLQHSLNILQGNLAPLETARTCLAMARVMRRAERQIDAEPFEKKASEIILVLFPPLWPEDMPLPSRSASSATTPCFPYFLLFQAILELNCRQLVKSAPLFFSGILSAFMTAFGALHGHIVHEKEKKRECIAASDSDEYEASAEDGLSDGESYRIAGFSDGGKNMSRIIIKILSDDREVFILSISGYFGKAILQILDENMYELLASQILSEISNHQRKQQTHSHTLLRSPVYMAQPGEGAVFFRSPEMKELIKNIDLIAPTDASVLLIGESGVGKERLARRIHDQSGRSGEFIPVNLASIPSSLFESECLGYEKGSFTGAGAPKKGLFELADNGTLFLDEIADVPMDIQVKLLRILQERAFRHVGGLKQIHSRFRVIAATNSNLEKAVAEGKLRADLYFRLNTISLFIPPLRKRRGDILFLADIFLEQYCQQYGKKRYVLSDREAEVLLAMPWPGNVRELMHFMERLAILGDFQRAKATSAVYAWDFPSETSRSRLSETESTGFDFLHKDEIISLAEMEARYFTFVYRQKKGKVTGKNGVAQALGISDHTAFNWIKKLDLVK